MMLNSMNTVKTAEENVVRPLMIHIMSMTVDNVYCQKIQNGIIAVVVIKIKNSMNADFAYLKTWLISTKKVKIAMVFVQEMLLLIYAETVYLQRIHRLIHAQNVEIITS